MGVSDFFKDKGTKKLINDIMEKNDPGKKQKTSKVMLNKFEKEKFLKQDAIESVLNKHKPKKIKQMSQNEMLQKLEEEKSKEKEQKVRDAYDMIILAIKNFFANKFNKNKEQVQNQIMEVIKNDKTLTEKTLAFLEKNYEFEILANEILGKQFVNFVKKKAISSLQKSNTSEKLNKDFFKQNLLF